MTPAEPCAYTVTEYRSTTSTSVRLLAPTGGYQSVDAVISQHLRAGFAGYRVIDVCILVVSASQRMLSAYTRYGTNFGGYGLKLTGYQGQATSVASKKPRLSLLQTHSWLSTATNTSQTLVSRFSACAIIFRSHQL
jgi:hypothetical protein